MALVLAVAEPLPAAGALLAGAAGVWVLLAGRPRARAWAMLAAPLAAVLALATVAGEDLADAIGGRVALAAAGGVVALAVVVALALVIRRRPQALALLALGALPFRVPVPMGDETVNLLLPLYGVIAAGCLAHALTWLRGRPPALPGGEADRRRVRVDRVLAVVVGLYAAQALYSTDVEQAIKSLCFFYVPFAVLYRQLTALAWTPRLLLRAFTLLVGLALAFAAIGVLEFATGHLLVSNPKVLSSNELKPYFRVNSLFCDPNIYGRFLALTRVTMAAALRWTRRPDRVGLLGGALILLWAGMVFSLSQSSFAALLVGLAVVAALRWRPAPVIGVLAAGLVAAAALVLIAPGAVGLQADSVDDLDRATSGRVALVGGGLEMARDRPIAGFGSGAFAERYRAREDVRSRTTAAISHTTPVTIAAEQGIVGLAAYLALLWVALALVFSGARDAAAHATTAHAIARTAIAAAFAALLAHTMAYAAFLEDPLTWALLAAAAGARLATLPDERRRRAERRAAARGRTSIAHA